MDINKKCQVFTPREIVHQLLDCIGYTHNLYGLKVSENSCGDGNILCEIVTRYIVDCIKNGLPTEDIKDGLERDIFAAEIDLNHCESCLKNLNLITEKFGIINVQWNIMYGDFLKANINNYFDFVIGNPPYISYSDLNFEQRSFLRKNFSVCKRGKFDYFYAFIEASFKSLKKTGKLAYLIPTNLFKNQFALEARELLMAHLTDIYDYTLLKLFKNKSTTSAIIVVDLGSNYDEIIYHDLMNGQIKHILKSSLGAKWAFNQNKTYTSNETIVRFGDLFNAATSIATLLNEAFIIGKFEEQKDFIIVNNCKIEKCLLKKAVSPRSINYNRTEYILFPYYYEDKYLKRYAVEEFENRFPFAVQYLRQYEYKLSKRDNDKSTKWFEFGRSQALAHLNQEKLLISTLVTKQVKVHKLNIDTIPTAGIYIVPFTSYSLDLARKILESDAFYNYAKNIGVISNGKSFRISPFDVNNYIFDLSKFEV